jgi:hypothetical protein
VIDDITLSSKAPEHEAVARTLEVMRAADARTDREKVEAAVDSAVEQTAAGEPASVPMGTVRLSDELVTKAQQTAARISFIEDASLLEPYGGVAGTLRYRIWPFATEARPKRSCRGRRG